MPICLRDVQTQDLTSVLKLNNQAGSNILPMTEADVARFHDTAPYFKVGIVNDEVAAFLIALNDQSHCDGQNFQWFKKHFQQFTYIDRIVVSAKHRGHGLGRSFYADASSFAEVYAPQLCCEVFMDPPNDIALLFHSMFGFKEVGQQVMTSAGRRVSMLSKELCSFPYIEQTYLSQQGLPDVPWMPRMRETNAGAYLSKECA